MSDPSEKTQSKRLFSLRNNAEQKPTVVAQEMPTRRKFAPKALSVPRRKPNNAMVDNTPSVKNEVKSERHSNSGRGLRGERGGRGRGLSEGGRYNHMTPRPSGKVAFVGAKSAGSSSSVSKKKTSVSAADGLGISVLDGTHDLDSTRDAFVSSQWPPTIESPFDPVTFPFGNLSSMTEIDIQPVFYDAQNEPILKEDAMLFVQLPTRLPFSKDIKTEKSPSVSTSDDTPLFDDVSMLKPQGYFGKIQVHQSGKMILKIGDIHFDVSAGLCPSFCQEICTMETQERSLQFLGPVAQHLIVTPDFDTMLG